MRSSVNSVKNLAEKSYGGGMDLSMASLKAIRTNSQCAAPKNESPFNSSRRKRELAEDGDVSFLSGRGSMAS